MVMRVMAAAALCFAATASWGAAGDLDAGFGMGGVVVTSVGSPYSVETGRDVLVQPDGRIVAVGLTYDSPDFGMLLVRYEADGTLDPSFGTNGVVAWPGPIAEALAAKLQPDGKIVAVGAANGGAFGVVRFDADGSLDTAFGNGGWMTTQLGSSAWPYAIAVQPDGKIIVAGTTQDPAGSRFVVLRYDANGVLDPTFGPGGIVRTGFGTGPQAYDEGLAMALRPDGTIVVGGDTYDGDTHFALARYTSDGHLDASFGAGGRAITDLGGLAYGASVRALAVQPDGKLVAVGLTNPNGGYDIAAVRYRDDGSVDTSFGVAGHVVTDLYGSIEYPKDVAVQADGKLVVVGETGSLAGLGGDFFAVRYTADGSLDGTFGTGGIVTTHVPPETMRFCYGNGVALQADSKILLVGHLYDTFTYTQNDLVLLRYLGDCGDGMVETSEACDAGELNGADGSCCDGTCAFRPPTITCRAAAGVCDAPEQCTGTSAGCPSDAKIRAGTTCRAAVDTCDAIEECDGVGDACPPDVFASSALECRPSTGPCDVAEHCGGTSASCPHDAKAPAGTVCREAAGDCDVLERCDGIASACPPDGFEPSTTTCRVAGGRCDVAEFCTGASASCPVDAKVPASTICRTAAAVCDVAEACDGTMDACPADALAGSTTVCRPSAAACDVPERCTGADIACPADTGLPDDDGDAVCDAQDDCPADFDPAQADGDGDGTGDACDPCTNGAIATRAKLTLARLLPPGGDEKLVLAGEATIPTAPPLAPPSRGVRLLLTAVSGTTLLDTTIPSGAYDSTAKTGWLTNGAGTAWTYKSPSTSPAGARKVVLRATEPGDVKIRVRMQGGSYVVLPADLPITATLVLDVPAASGGQCATFAFGAVAPTRPSCAMVGGRTVRCR
jgi:uncharacterized delta-60 repeat protein